MKDPTEEEVVRIRDDDEGGGGDDEDEKDIAIDKLRKHVETLSDRCSKLEAQNIIAVAQQLDILCRVLSWTLSLLTYYVCVKILFWMIDTAGNLLVDDDNKGGVISAINSNYNSHSSWEQNIRFTTTILKQVLTHPTTIILIKYTFATLPYIQHRYFDGLAHRRFEVFTVTFLMLIRIKSCRWRSNVFATATKPPNEEEGDGSDRYVADGNSNDDDNNNIFKNDDKATPTTFGEGISEDDIWEANYEINARFLYLSILRVRGLWTKVAQYMSSRADFVPVSYVRELGRLQDEAPETEWSQVKKMLLRAGLWDCLCGVEERPVASASIGQVHVGWLKKTNEKVVVKVQHPTARRLLVDDFRSLRIIARIVAMLEPEYAFVEILMKEWAKEARKELDFTLELQNLKSARGAIDMMVTPTSELVSTGKTKKSERLLLTNPTSSSPKSLPFEVEIPRPYEELSNRDILVMSFCEGKRVDDIRAIESWGIPKEAVVDGVAQAFAHMTYVTDIFNGDPHPGNIFIRPGTSGSSQEGFTVVLLDWGLAKRLPEEKRIGFCQLTYAASTLDFGLMLDSFKTMGLRMKRENVAEDMEGVRFLLRDMAPRTKARRRLKHKMKTDRARLNSRKRGERVPVESKAYPGEFFFFVRTNELLHGLGSRLGVEMTYLDLLLPYAEQGLHLSSVYRNDENIPSSVLTDNVLDTKLNQDIQRILQKLDEEGNIAGAQVCVLDSTGRALANTVFGHMGGLKRGMAMRSDALILGFSCTKAVTATLAHLMVDEGYLTYDEPICERVWPAFCPYEVPPEDIRQALPSMDDLDKKWAWKRSITLRHVLTHSSGLWFALPPNMTIKTMASCESCCSAFEYSAASPEEFILPVSRPGEKCQYHFLSFGWLVAGALRGAYSLRHGRKDVTFEDVYESLLSPKLSAITSSAGFRPCGGTSGHPMALTDADIDLSRMVQLRREAEAMGESRKDDGHDTEETKNDVFRDIRGSFRGKEFLLDSRIWNCEEARVANVSAAGGRFSATGLANFYYALGSGKITKPETLDSATRCAVDEESLQTLQGQTILSSSNAQEEERTRFGLGYQLIRFDANSEPSAFGHAGVGGSIGFYHKSTGTSVAIMLNKTGTERGSAMRIVKAIASHLNW